jgi:hypothetical protein
VDSRGEVLRAFDYDAETCFDKHAGATLGTLARECGSRFAQLVLISPSPTPADQPLGPNAGGPYFLLEKPLVTPEETAAYYATIGAPATLTEFRTRYGFDVPGAEVTASYYNSGDLGIGRRMHCASFTDATGPGTACVVENFGVFGGTVADGLAGTLDLAATPLASVAMVYRAPISAPNAVSFMVYGAAGTLVDQAPLDTQGDNPSIPSNCLNCHGSASSYDPITHSVSGARFLPFDAAAFTFSEQSGFTRFAQEEALRKLNVMVAASEPSPGSMDQLSGMYSGAVGVSGNTGNWRWVPDGWYSDPQSFTTYREVVAPFCRSCHASHAAVSGAASDLAFVDAAGFKLKAPLIMAAVCGQRDIGMPNAEVTLRAMWSGRARAYLVAYLDMPGACAPRP